METRSPVEQWAHDSTGRSVLSFLPDEVDDADIDVLSEKIFMLETNLMMNEETISDMENDTACLPEDRSVTEYVGQLLEKIAALEAENENQHKTIRMQREDISVLGEALDALEARLAMVKTLADDLDDSLSDLGLESEETVINNAMVCSCRLDAILSTTPMPVAVLTEFEVSLEPISGDECLLAYLPKGFDSEIGKVIILAAEETGGSDG